MLGLGINLNQSRLPPSGGAPSDPAFGYDPVAAGNSMVGETLSWSDLGDPTGYDALEYVWKRDGTPVGTDSTYVITGDDVGCVLTGEINLTGGAGANFTETWPTTVAAYDNISRWIDAIYGYDINDGSALHPYRTPAPAILDGAMNYVFITGMSPGYDFASGTGSALRLIGATRCNIGDITGLSPDTLNITVHNLDVGAIEYASYMGSTTINVSGSGVGSSTISSIAVPTPASASDGSAGNNGGNDSGAAGADGSDGNIGSPNGAAGGSGESATANGEPGASGGAGASGPHLVLNAVALGTYTAHGGGGGAGGSGGAGGTATGGAGGAGGDAYNEPAAHPTDVQWTLTQLLTEFQFSYARDGAFGTKVWVASDTDPSDGRIFVYSGGWSTIADMRDNMIDALNAEAPGSSVASGDNIVTSYLATGASASHSGASSGWGSNSVSGGGSGLDAVPHDGGDGGAGGDASATGGNGGDGGDGGDGGSVRLTNGATCSTCASLGGSGGAPGTGGAGGTAIGGTGGAGGNATNSGSFGTVGSSGEGNSSAGSNGAPGSDGSAGSIF